MTDLNFPMWNPRVLEMKQTSTGPPGVGTTVRSTHPMRRALDERIIEYEPNRRITLEATSGPIRGTRVTFSMETIAGKTRLNLTIDLMLSGFYRLVGPFAARRAERESGAVSNVKRILESETQS